jgi:hypothetical protein
MEGSRDSSSEAFDRIGSKNDAALAQMQEPGVLEAVHAAFDQEGREPGVDALLAQAAAENAGLATDLATREQLGGRIRQILDTHESPGSGND